MGFIIQFIFFWLILEISQSRVLRGSIKQSGLETVPCEQKPPHKWFRNKDDLCVICVDCLVLGLQTKRNCRPRKDAECLNKCINKDAVYDSVVGLCREKEDRSTTSTSTHTVVPSVLTVLPHTSPDQQSSPTENARMAQSQDFKSHPGSRSFSHAFVAVIVVIVVLVLVVLFLGIFIWKKQGCKMAKPESRSEKKNKMNNVKRARSEKKNTMNNVNAPPTTLLDNEMVEEAQCFNQDKDPEYEDEVTETSGVYESIAHETSVSSEMSFTLS